MPQENSGRCDVRWVKLGGPGRPAIETRAAGRPFSFAARKYTPQELDRAEHLHELRELDGVMLHVDYEGHGIGSGSLGPKPFEGDKLYTGPFEFTTGLRVIDGD